MKNIVLCLDGTANEFAANNTNVIKLFSILDRDPERQACYYHPGVGTMPPPGALTWLAKKITLILGLAFGYGLSADIGAAYAFLIQNYRPGDRVYVFGFSRGAYTARALCSLVRMYGLIGRGNEPLIPYALRLLREIHEAGTPKAKAEYFALAESFRETFSVAECRPWFVGVWDTVSSVGWVANPLYLPFTGENDAIEIGRHAVAIDERRAFFRTNLWRGRDGTPPAGPKDMKQVWFPGVHCDVGGGYAESESGPASEALYWMLREAEAKGLLVDPVRRTQFLAAYAKPDPDRKRHESLTPPWWPAEFFPKRHWDWTRKAWEWRANMFRRRTIPPKSQVHVSAQALGPDYCRRLPTDVTYVD
jgi:uncharacterized protein (DUF2235 family)